MRLTLSNVFLLHSSFSSHRMNFYKSFHTIFRTFNIDECSISVRKSNIILFRGYSYCPFLFFSFPPHRPVDIIDSLSGCSFPVPIHLIQEPSQNSPKVPFGDVIFSAPLPVFQFPSCRSLSQPTLPQNVFIPSFLTFVSHPNPGQGGSRWKSFSSPPTLSLSPTPNH